MRAIRLAAAAWIAASALPARPADVVARVGSTDVTLEEVRAWVEALGDAERGALARDPALLPQLLRARLARIAVLSEAQAKRWDQSPAVKAQLDRIREDALVEIYLQSVSRPPDGYPGEAELLAAYEASKAAFAVPRQYRVAQIFVAAGRGGADDGRKRAEEIARKVRARGADFAAVARAESDEKEAGARGGEIGWLTEEQLVPGIRATVAALAKDGVSDAIRLDDGWHVVKLLDVKPAGTRTFAEVKEALASRLRAEKAQASRQAYLARLLEQSPPAVNELALSRVLPKGTREARAP